MTVTSRSGTPPPALSEGLVGALAEILTPAHVVTDPEVTAPYAADWSGRFDGATPAVLRPASTGEVAAVVDLCRREGIALTLQGGNTGLVGGGVPLQGEVVVSLRRLAALGEVDTDTGQVVAGAGVTVGGVQRAAEAAGWSYGIDLASRDSATVGGTVATNAAGLHFLRDGDTRAQLVGVEAVLGNGSVVSHLSGLRKDNTGYHLPSLLCGSEGTLAVVTGACLRLVPPRPVRVVVLLAFDSVAAAVSAAAAVRREGTDVDAVELFLAEGVELVCRTGGLRPPFPVRHAAFLLVEGAARRDPTAELADLVASLDGVADSAVGADPARRAELWRYREDHSLAVRSLGAAHKLDVTLPGARLAEFIERVPGEVEAVAPTARTWLFGHAGDGNVHVNVTGPPPADEAVDDAVFALVASYGGSISAEHGIGTAKRRWLHLNRTEAEIEAFRAIKRALDPAGILNPGVLLP